MCGTYRSMQFGCMEHSGALRLTVEHTGACSLTVWSILAHWDWLWNIPEHAVWLYGAYWNIQYLLAYTFKVYKFRFFGTHVWGSSSCRFVCVRALCVCVAGLRVRRTSILCCGQIVLTAFIVNVWVQMTSEQLMPILRKWQYFSFGVYQTT